MLLFLAACSPEYALSTVEPGGWTPVPVHDDGGSAITAEEDPAREMRRETFVLGGNAPTPVADFLFVVDESASMQTVVDRVRAAFAALPEGDAFPVEARVAVMGMVPGDPADLSRTHPAVQHPRRNRRGPGFLRLVRRSTIDDFAAVAPDDELRRFSERGCESAWFAPGDTDENGVPCLVGHTQISMDPVVAEAGLTALAQLLLRLGDQPLFRPGAAANVVFVSDTQDPGLRAGDPHLEDLVALRPDFAALAALVDEANTVASFRVHGIVPTSGCGESWAHLGPVYQEAAKASGGRTLDMCTADDYREFVREIGHEGAIPQRAVVALGRAALDAVVTVDGERVGFSSEPSGRALVLDRGLTADPSRVTVTYSYSPTRPGRRPR